MLLGLSLATTACGSARSTTALSQRSTTTTPTSADATTPPTASQTTTAPAADNSTSAGTAQASPPSSPLPGVVADCITKPGTLTTRPAKIYQACADAGLGVENMVWTSWTTTAATGRGTLWEKLCKPSCAAGTIGTYAVAITLSKARTSTSGPWFSLMKITWEGRQPPNTTPFNSLPLPFPQAPAGG